MGSLPASADGLNKQHWTRLPPPSLHVLQAEKGEQEWGLLGYMEALAVGRRPPTRWDGSLACTSVPGGACPRQLAAPVVQALPTPMVLGVLLPFPATRLAGIGTSLCLPCSLEVELWLGVEQLLSGAWDCMCRGLGSR